PAPVVSTPIVRDTPVPVAPAPVVVDTVVDIIVEEIMEEPKDTLSAAEMKLLETPILFGRVGDTLPSQEARLHALAIAEVLKKHPQVNLTVEGHTCNIGTDEVNTRIGLARATAVAALLVENGIDAGRLQPISRAHQEPVASNKTEAERQKNRRVVLKVL
ncbi:MAG TPA: OmpA family protein, partial [Pseudobacter sp.]|nr:OmpA family protein [Pseudobacter sp.]